MQTMKTLFRFLRRSPPSIGAAALGSPAAARQRRRRRPRRRRRWHGTAAAGTAAAGTAAALSRRLLGPRGYWPGAFWGGVGLGLGIGAIGYYGATDGRTTRLTTAATTTTTRRWSSRRATARSIRTRPGPASRCRRPRARRPDLLSEERPERGDDRGRSPRMQPLGDDAARRDGRREHLPARDLRLHGRPRLHRQVAPRPRRRRAAQRRVIGLVTDCARRRAWSRREGCARSHRRLPKIAGSAAPGEPRPRIRRQCTGLGVGMTATTPEGPVREDLSPGLPSRRRRHRLRARHRRMDPPLRRAGAGRQPDAPPPTM